MNVRFENVGDGNLFFTRQRQVFLHIRRGIEDRGDSRAVIAQQIREFGDPFGLDLFEDEGHGCG